METIEQRHDEEQADRPDTPRWVAVAVVAAVLVAVLVAFLLSRSDPSPDEATAPAATSTTDAGDDEPDDDPDEDGAGSATPEALDVGPGLEDHPDVVWLGTFEDDGWMERFAVEALAAPENLSVASAPNRGATSALRVDVAGSRDQRQRQGTDFRSNFTELGLEPMEEAYLRYDVWIPRGYDFVEGGKLPGLSGIGVDDPSWSTPSGGSYSTSGWSGRLLFQGDRSLSTYFYVHQLGSTPIWHNRNNDNDRVYGFTRYFTQGGGDSSAPRLELRPGRWNTVELHYRMNTPGEADGVFRGWLNGQLGMELDDVLYRDEHHDDLAISQLFFSYFYGGAKGPRQDQFVLFDNIAITTARVDVDES